jgi:hypothetical protein
LQAKVDYLMMPARSRASTITGAAMRPMTDVSDLNSPEFAQVRAQLARAFIEHKADLGPAAAAASDQAILDRVDDIMAVMLCSVAKAMVRRDAAWLARYSWFVDLIEALVEGSKGKPLDG